MLQGQGSRLPVLDYLFSTASLVWAMMLIDRASSRPAAVRAPKTLLVQSTVVCQNSYEWMQNSMGQSPCVVAAYIEAQCNEGNWEISALPSSDDHYTMPNATTQNWCSCSWATYNLISACTQCQGSEFTQSISTWTAWTLSCVDDTSDTTFFPADKVTLPNTTTIPYWATTNPTTWSGSGKFDADIAQNISQEGKPDITSGDLSSGSATSGSSSSGSKSNTGAIAGGVVGGVVGLAAILGLLVWFIFTRRRKDSRTLFGRRASGHVRTLSDGSTRHGPAVTHATNGGQTFPLMGEYPGSPDLNGARPYYPGYPQPMSERSGTSNDQSSPTFTRRTGPGSSDGLSGYATSPFSFFDPHAQGPEAVITPFPTNTNNSEAGGSAPANEPKRPGRLNPPSYADTMSGRAGHARQDSSTYGDQNTHTRSLSASTTGLSIASGSGQGHNPNPNEGTGTGSGATSTTVAANDANAREETPARARSNSAGLVVMNNHEENAPIDKKVRPTDE